MNTKNLLLLVCLLGFSSLAFAGIDVTFEQVNANGEIVADASSRLLAENDYVCSMILYTQENIQNSGGLQAVLNIFGPPYGGSVDDLNTLNANPTLFHNLRRIVYQGPGCDCTVTVHQETNASGKSKDYFSHTAVTSSEQTKIDIDFCWGNKAESLTVQCSA